jgi:hypothetical protein
MYYVKEGLFSATSRRRKTVGQKLSVTAAGKIRQNAAIIAIQYLLCNSLITIRTLVFSATSINVAVAI